ncbi:MAG TPA: hypothetical protein VFE23_07505 [Usitatibacter sp.]|nr:hypothetical protein [Usitatibacter sp.]
MSMPGRAAATIAGLFIDDGTLAICVALILAVMGFMASTPWLGDAATGAAFVATIAIALLENVVRSAWFSQEKG